MVAARSFSYVQANSFIFTYCLCIGESYSTVVLIRNGGGAIHYMLCVDIVKNWFSLGATLSI